MDLTPCHYVLRISQYLSLLVLYISSLVIGIDGSIVTRQIETHLKFWIKTGIKGNNHLPHMEILGISLYVNGQIQ